MIGVALIVLMFGTYQIREKGITFGTIKEIRAAKQMIQNYVDKNYEESFKKLNIENAYSNHCEAELETDLTYEEYYAKCYNEFVDSKRKLDELGIVIKNYRFESISKREESNYSIHYRLDIVWNDTTYKDILMEFVGKDGRFLYGSFGYDSTEVIMEKQLEDALINLLFDY